MSFHLIIGDTSNLSASIAKRMFGTSALLTSDNYHNRPNVECYYTSMANLNDIQLLDIAMQATEVHYYPPMQWEDAESMEGTEQFLTELALVHNITVRNFYPVKDPINALTLIDQRKSELPQAWVVGCSVAYGFGLSDYTHRYGYKVAKHFNMEWSDLTSAGSGVDWATDQILRSDIRKDDIIIWGITGINRLSYYKDNKYFPILPGTPMMQLSSEEQDFFTKLSIGDSNNRLHQTIRQIHQVVNYSNKIGSRLAIFVQDRLIDQTLLPILKNYISITGKFIELDPIVDYTTGDKHPGSQTNANWSKQIINFIESTK